ncbi:hypothetical protein BJV85_001521 [Clostridium acetobutylicum]|uniref:Uncharacterized protein, homolog of gi 2274936 Eubacterium acidaminophilum n=1 Tax=Clostridium acetobutylicum (strain ATCC 824 / DSM 792 / JCM 1419 / IAM 19013 / LMG 5710 / NBRC 13948 / NRRL B-527 / VKM B-1787 / 2291 / W) TaxID=272562 RepID=Q97GK2_CLOAB|nr:MULTISPECIES: hypothetical protein [Clostridium]AAK80320.1 Uncharacterized protein, homolog of gi/2274936 Eubacterium acidaminophilum [Clostridium acetobutylicum ATCC 824]ADZ21415.1 Conserved hypothetical protein [Clostridium acetobutylicum EA 2018]AEI32302.1 hypothetical protein SMB_G2398 [Clostridium acetobutylicum DSM 1731]AWV79259.1 hypothetical protein DK921_03940 [Clostridium acetobutylicum]MBC2394772.1 hypothetical protein [Clostridium acetobutylicum]
MKTVIVDNRINELERNNLKKLDLNLIFAPTCNDISEAISSHPDEIICKVSDSLLIAYKNLPKEFISSLECLNIKVLQSFNTFKKEYPYDVALNGVVLKNFFIHNIKHTDPILHNHISKKTIINVKQGYTKCSTAVISDSAIITSDIGIARASSAFNLDVLLLPPGDILLPGFDYGFIGGTCGLIGKNLLAFYGSLEKYKFKNKVLNFLNKHNITPIYLSNEKLVDRGSIICINH